MYDHPGIPRSSHSVKFSWHCTFFSLSRPSSSPSSIFQTAETERHGQASFAILELRELSESNIPVHITIYTYPILYNSIYCTKLLLVRCCGVDQGHQFKDFVRSRGHHTGRVTSFIFLHSDFLTTISIFWVLLRPLVRDLFFAFLFLFLYSLLVLTRLLLV